MKTKKPVIDEKYKGKLFLTSNGQWLEYSIKEILMQIVQRKMRKN